MALRQVRQFVGQYRGVLAFGLGVEEQPAVDPDDAARGGKGVELAAIDEDEFQASVLQLAGFGQAIHAGFDVIFQLRVVELVDLATQQAQPARPSWCSCCGETIAELASPSDGRSSAWPGRANRQASVSRVGRSRFMHEARVGQRYLL